jgi:hypothetical protein
MKIKVLTRDSKVEKAVQEVEKLMDMLGLSITIVPGGLAVRYNGIVFPIADFDSGGDHSGSLCFPRMTEGERLVAE